MATQPEDLGELGKPLRRVRSVRSLPVAAGAEYQQQQQDGDDGGMGEPTLGELLLVEVRDMKRLLSDAMTEQARMRVQVDTHDTDIRDLKTWRDRLPEAVQQHQVQRFQMTWQTIGGILGMLTFLAYMIGPHIRLQ